MRRTVPLALALLFLAFTAAAKDAFAPPPPARVQATGFPYSLDRGTPARIAAGTVVDTTVLGAWTFDDNFLCVDEGWTSVDRTFDPEYFHVDDFAGLGGGTSGNLVPLEGNQSMWCGLRPDPGDPELCRYGSLPGYGNGWRQSLRTADCLSVTGDVIVDYITRWDVEPGEDYCYLRFDACDSAWVTSRTFHGGGAVSETHVIADSLHSGALRLEFLVRTDGAWSDEDGLWDTDGAMIVDSLTVSDATGAVLPTELFEAEAVGDQQTLSGNWVAASSPDYGDFAGLFRGAETVQEKCAPNLTCFWGFFAGSTVDYACGGFPGQAVVPYNVVKEELEFYLDNEIWSPLIPVVGSGNEFELSFDVYRDLSLDASVFYAWDVRSVVDGCPTPWRGDNLVNWGEEKAWIRHTVRIGAYVEPGATHIQVALGALDLCGVFCWIYGFSGECHSHAPLFDNVTVRRFDVTGPRWSVRRDFLFQDNFPGDGTVTGTVRADNAWDTQRGGAGPFIPGDSVSIVVTDPLSGIGNDPYTGFGPSVYAWVSVRPPGQPGKTGAALSGGWRWPVVDSLAENGEWWYAVRMDSVFYTPERDYWASDQYCADLNDNLFTPGDTVLYYFSATNDGAGETTYWSEYTGATNDRAAASSNPMDLACLPGTSPASGDRILYVDAADSYGAQPFFESAFALIGLLDHVDRFDVRSSDDALGTRVADPIAQLVPSYQAIVLGSSYSSGRVIPDGTTEKSDDFAVLKTFLDFIDTPGGVYLSGDHIATWWESSAAPNAVALRDYLGYTVSHTDHEEAGLGISPLVVGVPGGCFDHAAGPDTSIAFGACGSFGRFDVLVAQGTAGYEAMYVAGGSGAGAVVGQKTINSVGTEVGMMLAGFGLENLRDDTVSPLPDRAEHLQDVVAWLAGIPSTPTGDFAPSLARNALEPNYPNPFNPTTTIEFQVRARARVRLDVFDVAGRRVRALVDDERIPGVIHRVVWDGTNDDGNAVASGVYFCRLVTEDFTMTRKAVLLK